jgi:hypothetical protein
MYRTWSWLLWYLVAAEPVVYWNLVVRSRRWGLFHHSTPVPRLLGGRSHKSWAASAPLGTLVYSVLCSSVHHCSLLEKPC